MEGQVRAASWPLWVALVLSLAWIGLLVAMLGVADLLRMDGRELLFTLPFLLVGPILFFVVAAALRSGTGRILLPQVEEEAADAALGMEAATTGLASRLAALRATMMADIDTLSALGARIEEQGRAAGSALADLKAMTEGTVAAATMFEAAIAQGGVALDAMAARFSAMEAGVADTRAQAETAADAISARVRALAQEGASAAGEMAEALARLGTEAAAGRAEIDAFINRAAVDGAAALDATRAAAQALAEGTEQHRGMLEAATGEARATLSAIGAEAARALGRHLDALVAQARELETRIAGQAGATETLAAAGEKAFQRLDARLDHSATTTNRILDGLAARIETTNREIDALAEPVRHARAAVSELDGAVAAARETALAAVALFEGILPDRAHDIETTARAMAGEIDRLVELLGAAEERARALAAPLADGQAGIEAAVARFAEQREAIGIAGEALVVELEQARQLITDVEQATEASSLAAATRLVDALSRVRDVSAQATGTMRQMLDGLVAEARDSLGAAALQAMQESFAGPIAQKAREAEDAAKAAAERSAASLAALASALAGLDGRTESALKAIGERSGAELAGAAALLTDRLATSAIDLSAAMGRPMDAADWEKWRRGERGLFGRRALALLEKSDAVAIRDLTRKDPDFDDQARLYIGTFEQLLERLRAAGQESLALFLQGTDQGRLAAILSEALEG